MKIKSFFCKKNDFIFYIITLLLYLTLLMEAKYE